MIDRRHRAYLAAALLASGLASAQTSPPAGSPRLAPQPAAGPPAKPPQLGLCMACHGINGVARQPGTPHIGGLDAAYLAAALWAYRDGRRRFPAMNAISNALQPRDIEELARWYAAQPLYTGPAR